MHALRSDRHRRNDVRQHGIGHDRHTVDLYQYAGMTEPDRAQALRWRRAQRLRRKRDHRNSELRLANLSLAVQAHRFPERAPCFLRRRVLEAAIDELGRLAHAFEAVAGEAAAEGRELKDGIADESKESDGAEQDPGEFFHHSSLAPSDSHLPAPPRFVSSSATLSGTA
jgi:hypothetical protein